MEKLGSSSSTSVMQHPISLCLISDVEIVSCQYIFFSTCFNSTSASQSLITPVHYILFFLFSSIIHRNLILIFSSCVLSIFILNTYVRFLFRLDELCFESMWTLRLLRIKRANSFHLAVNVYLSHLLTHSFLHSTTDI